MNEKGLVKDLSFRVYHTMLLVADLDRSVAFYTNSAPTVWASARGSAIRTATNLN